MNAYETASCAVIVDVEKALQNGLIADESLWEETVNFASLEARIRAHHKNAVAVRKGFFDQAADIDQAGPLKSPIEHFLDQLYTLSSQGDVDRGVDYVFETMHHWLTRDGTTACDAILGSVDVTKLSSDLILAFLAITFSARDKLHKRKAFYAMAKSAIRKECGWIMAHRLLSPLK